MLAAGGRGNFYVLCPDNAVTRATDEKRMQMGGRRHHQEPPGAVALAQGLGGGIRALHEGVSWAGCGVRYRVVGTTRSSRARNSDISSRRWNALTDST